MLLVNVNAVQLPNRSFSLVESEKYWWWLMWPRTKRLGKGKAHYIMFKISLEFRYNLSHISKNQQRWFRHEARTSRFVLRSVTGKRSLLFRLVLFRENWTHLPSLPAHCGHVGATGVAIPRAVGISGEAAFGAGLTVQLTLVEAELGHTFPGAHKQPLLQMGGREEGQAEKQWKRITVRKGRKGRWNKRKWTHSSL